MNPSIRLVLHVFAAIVSGCRAKEEEVAAKPKPNVLFILMDDMGNAERLCSKCFVTNCCPTARFFLPRLQRCALAQS